jgi:hypothetical protein
MTMRFVIAFGGNARLSDTVKAHVTETRY